MLQVYFKSKNNSDLDNIKDKKFKAGSWVVITEPTADELKRLVDELGIDEGTLTDTTDPYEAPRIEKEGEAFFFFTRVPVKEGGEVKTIPVTFILTETVLISISQANLELFNKFIDTRISFLTTQKTKLFFLLIKEVNVYYQKYLNEINRKLRKISINLEDINNKDIIRFVQFERTLHDFITALVPTNNAFNRLLSGKFIKMYDEDSELVEDLSLSNGQLISACEASLKTIVNVRNAYSTIMTNNLNQLITTLTILTVVLAVPTMIASFFGMNTTIPINTDNPRVFWIILVLAFTAAFLVWRFVSIWFRKN